ncbi:MAG TPA: PilZ domain-containing protein [Tepidisphaeraceae bacterium]|jgi:c-di-GMP-binding flagellar brake protein YcgR
MTLVCDPEFDTADDAGTLRLERRHGQRVCQQRPAAVYEPLVSRLLQGTTRDVSATGLQIAFRGDVSLRAGRILQVHVGRSAGSLCLPHRRGMMPARVVWARDDAETGEVVCGIEFLTTIHALSGAA